MKNTENDLIKSFLLLLETKTIENISIRDIANNASLSTGVAYRHFSNKSDLILKSFIYSSRMFRNEIDIDFSTSENTKLSLNKIIDYSKENVSIFYLLLYLDYCSFIDNNQVEQIKMKYCHVLSTINQSLKKDNSEIMYFILIPLFKYCIDYYNNKNSISKDYFINKIIKNF